MPDLESLRKIGDVRLLLWSSLIMFFLEVTGGAWGVTVAEGQDDHPVVIGAVLLMVWVGLRFHPPQREIWTDEEREKRRKD